MVISNGSSEFYFRQWKFEILTCCFYRTFSSHQYFMLLLLFFWLLSALYFSSLIYSVVFKLAAAVQCVRLFFTYNVQIDYALTLLFLSLVFPSNFLRYIFLPSFLFGALFCLLNTLAMLPSSLSDLISFSPEIILSLLQLLPSR